MIASILLNFADILTLMMLTVSNSLLIAFHF